MKDTSTIPHNMLTLADAAKMSSELKPLIQIGKNGVTQGLIDEINKALKKKKLIKIKCLRYFLESLTAGNSNKEKLSGIADFFSEKLDCKVVDKKGFTFTLWRQ